MSDYRFVSQDTSEIIDEMIERYQAETGHVLRDADPDRLFLAWVASVIVQERVNQNYVGNQNIPSRARGENLDALGKWIFNLERREALPAHTTERFAIGTARSSAIIIPAGTRVTDPSRTLVWETTADGTIAAGNLYVDIPVRCQTTGKVGNGFAIGAITTLIDVDNVPYDVTVSNTTASDGGTQTENDKTYFDRLRASLDGYSSAGSRGAYIFHAKSVSSEIADVKVIRPRVSISKELLVWENGDDKCAFLGGDGLIEETLVVKEHGSSTEATITTDYTVTYADGLMTISIVENGGLDEATSLDITINSDSAGCVDIYALMNDGTIAGTEIKNAIAAACNDATVRPLTDKVSVKDASYSSYSINLTYYTSTDDTRTAAEIAAAVNAAVDEYVAWQRSKIGRDINRSKLFALVMATGVKRVNITAPSYTVLADGSNFDVPQVAQFSGTKTITNGGAENE